MCRDVLWEWYIRVKIFYRYIPQSSVFREALSAGGGFIKGGAENGGL
jgi:hypothetical protein